MNILAELERNRDELARIIAEAKAARDPFVAHLLTARRTARQEMGRKQDKRFKDDVWRTYRRAQELGYRGSAEEWYRVVTAGL